VRKRRERTQADCIALHLEDGRAPEFDSSGQWARIHRARRLLEAALRECPTPATIVELGCGAGDISGPQAEVHAVVGVDIVPEAQRVCAERWPKMEFCLMPVEEAVPHPCDVVVLCEFLEHVADPEAIVRAWLPMAKWSIIGHPLNEPDEWGEEGHTWSYDEDDFDNWFRLGGHEMKSKEIFPMTIYPEMVLGMGKRA